MLFVALNFRMGLHAVICTPKELKVLQDLGFLGYGWQVFAYKVDYVHARWYCMDTLGCDIIQTAMEMAQEYDIPVSVFFK